MNKNFLKIITVIFALSLLIAFLLLQSGFFEEKTIDNEKVENEQFIEDKGMVKIHVLDSVKEPIIINDSVKRILLSTSKTFIISDEKLKHQLMNQSHKIDTVR